MNRLTLTTWQRRKLLRQLDQTHDARLYRRTLAVLEFARGKTIPAIAESFNVSRQSVYNWIEVYEQTGEPAALADHARSGRPPRWTPEATHRLRGMLQQSPQQCGYSATEWTVPLLQEELRGVLGQEFSDDTLRRQLRNLDFVWKRPRYVLESDPEREKKTPDSPVHPVFAAPQRPARGG